ncbi:MAG: hypothetical protein U1E21_02130 [Reyranellaceae bacterium]
MERQFNIWAINPKQMDRFRDRYSPAGAKDDRRDGLVMASACAPIRIASAVSAPPIRSSSSCANGRALPRTRRRTHRLTNACGSACATPAFLDLGADMEAPWLLELWQLVPTPDRAKRVRQGSIAAILKRNRIRRLDAAQALDILRKSRSPSPTDDQGRLRHITTLIDRIA